MGATERTLSQSQRKRQRRAVKREGQKGRQKRETGMEGEREGETWFLSSVHVMLLNTDRDDRQNCITTSLCYTRAQNPAFHQPNPFSQVTHLELSSFPLPKPFLHTHTLPLFLSVNNLNKFLCCLSYFTPVRPISITESITLPLK